MLLVLQVKQYVNYRLKDSVISEMLGVAGALWEIHLNHTGVRGKLLLRCNPAGLERQVEGRLIEKTGKVFHAGEQHIHRYKCKMGHVQEKSSEWSIW